MSLRDTLTNYASDGRRAYKIVDTMFAGIVRALRRDPRLHALSVFEIELLPRDEYVEAERKLVAEMRDRIHVDVLAEEGL